MRSSRGSRSYFEGFTRSPVHKSESTAKQEQARIAAPTLCGYFGSMSTIAGAFISVVTEIASSKNKAASLPPAAFDKADYFWSGGASFGLMESSSMSNNSVALGPMSAPA